MSLVNLFLCIVAFAGSLSGIAMSFIAPEEIKPYRRYLAIFASLLFSLAALTPLIERGVTPFVVVPSFAVLLYLANRFTRYLKYAFPLLGLAIISSGIFLPIVSLFVFALGLPLGSLDMEESIHKDRLRFDMGMIMRKAWPYSLIILVGLLNLAF